MSSLNNSENIFRVLLETLRSSNLNQHSFYNTDLIIETICESGVLVVFASKPESHESVIAV